MACDSIREILDSTLRFPLHPVEQPGYPVFSRSGILLFRQGCSYRGRLPCFLRLPSLGSSSKAHGVDEILCLRKIPQHERDAACPHSKPSKPPYSPGRRPTWPTWSTWKFAGGTRGRTTG